MDQVEHAVFIFAHQTQGCDGKGVGQKRPSDGFKALAYGFRRVAWHFAGQGDVKAELLHHIGIAPTGQQGVLLRRQVGLAAAGQFGIGRGGAEAVQPFDDLRGKGGQGGGVAGDGQRQKPAQPGQRQTVQRGGGQACAQGFCGLRQGGEIRALGQHKGRLHRAMQSVFSGRGGQGGNVQPIHVRVGRGDAVGQIPAQPVCPKFGQRAGFGGVVDSETFEIGHDVASDLLCRAA